MEPSGLAQGRQADGGRRGIRGCGIDDELPSRWDGNRGSAGQVGFGPPSDMGTGDRIGPLSFPRTATGALLEVDLVPRLELMSLGRREFGWESEGGRVVASSCRGIHAFSIPYMTKRKTQ